MAMNIDGYDNGYLWKVVDIDGYHHWCMNWIYRQHMLAYIFFGRPWVPPSCLRVEEWRYKARNLNFLNILEDGLRTEIAVTPKSSNVGIAMP